MSEAFRFENVARRFGDKSVLRNLNLSVEQGQFIAIIGKSGCGKSTMLRLLAGLDAPNTGRITYGRSKNADETRIMFQEPRLLPWETVGKNVEVGLTGIAKGAAAGARTLAILNEVGLGDRLDDWPSQLSGGQKQRVALARALVGTPEILTLDEPLGALDALTRIEMQHLIERIWREKGFTAVLVTHDVAEAVILADRVIVLEEGAVALELEIDLPRPRKHGSAEVAGYEQKILDQLFAQDNAEAAI